jgi:hypothetical protein
MQSTSNSLIGTDNVAAASLARADHQWPAHFAVAYLPGSLPMGGVVPMTPIHAFSTPAAPLALATDIDLPAAVRTDIELGGLRAFLIENVVSASEADAIVEASERFGYREEAPGIATPPGMRMNKAVHWMADESMMAPLFQRIAHLLPAQIDGAALYPALSRRINMYRYDRNDVFNPHVDGDWPGFGLSEDRSQMLQWPGPRSCLSMLLYLNGPEEGVQGGSTRLFRPDRGHVDITPKKGSALFFRHGSGVASVLHAGARVFGDVPKYVARINVMYSQD